jgi:hypothetical protein
MQVYTAWCFVVLILSGVAVAVPGGRNCRAITPQHLCASLSFAAIAVQSSLHQP